MGKTADLAMVQKTIIDALHKEGKSQRGITERCGSSQSAVPVAQWLEHCFSSAKIVGSIPREHMY